MILLQIGGKCTKIIQKYMMPNAVFCIDIVVP